MARRRREPCGSGPPHNHRSRKRDGLTGHRQVGGRTWAAVPYRRRGEQDAHDPRAAAAPASGVRERRRPAAPAPAHRRAGSPAALRRRGPRGRCDSRGSRPARTGEPRLPLGRRCPVRRPADRGDSPPGGLSRGAGRGARAGVGLAGVGLPHVGVVWDAGAPALAPLRDSGARQGAPLRVAPVRPLPGLVSKRDQPVHGIPGNPAQLARRHIRHGPRPILGVRLGGQRDRALPSRRVRPAQRAPPRQARRDGRHAPDQGGRDILIGAGASPV